MASQEAVMRRRANRAAARLAKEAKANGGVVAAARLGEAQPSRRQKAAERAEWEGRVARRMAMRFDRNGEVCDWMRIDYRYWQCRVSGFDPEDPIMGWPRYGLRGGFTPSDAYRCRSGYIIQPALVFHWWCDLHPESRESLRRGGIPRDVITGQLFTGIAS